MSTALGATYVALQRIKLTALPLYGKTRPYKCSKTGLLNSDREIVTWTYVFYSLTVFVNLYADVRTEYRAARNIVGKTNVVI